MNKVAAVQLETGHSQTFDYLIPDRLKLVIGSRVTVPLRQKSAKGVVVEIKERSSFAQLKEILALDEEGTLPPDLLKLAAWMSSYYGSSMGKVLKVMLPSSIRKEMKEKEVLFVKRALPLSALRELTAELRRKAPKQSDVLDHLLKGEESILASEIGATPAILKALEKRGAITLNKEVIDRSLILTDDYFLTKPKTLTEDQAKALESIEKTMGSFAVHLLFGVTGSGKTEVYMRAIERVIREGKSALLLVPEISLTEQMIERFRARFKEGLAALHYRLSEGEKRDAWQRIQRGDAKVIIGPRSALFSPAPNIGLIIVDEEHEASYKQSEEAPRYHARDASIMRGKLLSCPVLLGSATPSLESYTNALNGKYLLSVLHGRASGNALPNVKVVDMREEYEKRGGFTLFSSPLIDGIKARMEKGEQTILFLNRRGTHTAVLCKACGNLESCSHCNTPFTYHKKGEKLVCHLCGEERPFTKICSSCKSIDQIQFKGFGTEQVERAVHALFPEIRTLRVDRDTTKEKGSHGKLLRAFGVGKADLLIGTQMVAKGLHFPEVTLVAVLNADSALNIPDFRASETSFQLITQVAGRAGRGARGGEVIIQTMMPMSRTIELAKKQDYEGFYRAEIEERRAFNFPPFVHLIRILFTSTDEKAALAAASSMERALLKAALPGEILPVSTPGQAKLKDQFRFHIIMKTNAITSAVKTLSTLWEECPVKGVRMLVDVDPTSTFF